MSLRSAWKIRIVVGYGGVQLPQTGGAGNDRRGDAAASSYGDARAGVGVGTYASASGEQQADSLSPTEQRSCLNRAEKYKKNKLPKIIQQ